MTYLSNDSIGLKTPSLRLIWATCLPVILAGCAEFFEKPAPAPVFQGGIPQARPIPEPVYPNTGPTPPVQPKDSDTAIEIKPLPSTPTIKPIEIKPEPIPTYRDGNSLLTPEQEQELAEFEHRQQQADEPVTQEAPPETDGAFTDFLPSPPVPETPPPPPFEPLTEFAPQSPAVGALMLAANKNTDQGKIDSATTSIERAIRIEPRNAALYYKLAVLRLEQNKPRLAEGLAKKSALLASGDKQLKKHSWLLIAKARDMQNNPEGAKEARAQAEKY